MTSQEPTSTRPYLIRAIHEWCTDNGFTPYLAVKVDKTVQVPREYVNDGEIVLNVSYDATGGMKLGNDFIEFKARFGGRPREIMVPVERVLAIYARESGQGMSFPVIDDAHEEDVLLDDAVPELDEASEATDEAAEQGADERVVQLVPVDKHNAPTLAAVTRQDGEEDGGDKPRPPSGGRPSLKIVK